MSRLRPQRRHVEHRQLAQRPACAAHQQHHRQQQHQRVPDQDGRCVATDTLRSPNSKRTKKPIAEIYVAQPKADQWICAAMYNFGDSFASTPLKFAAGTTTYPTRMQAAQEGARWLKKVLGHENIKRQKDLPIVLQWLDDILQSPDPDWTPDMAQEVAK